ncbi:MAG: hypothetical protein JWM04_2616 [Verrucomicrobiales bacterium]|jgi:chromate transport protein ChrA|nr:hypothetical protein [Verrucomicrobiales bacterium]
MRNLKKRDESHGNRKGENIGFPQLVLSVMKNAIWAIVICVVFSKAENMVYFLSGKTTQSAISFNLLSNIDISKLVFLTAGVVGARYGWKQNKRVKEMELGECGKPQPRRLSAKQSHDPV